MVDFLVRYQEQEAEPKLIALFGKISLILDPCRQDSDFHKLEIHLLHLASSLQSSFLMQSPFFHHLIISSLSEFAQYYRQRTSLLLVNHQDLILSLGTYHHFLLLLQHHCPIVFGRRQLNKPKTMERIRFLKLHFHCYYADFEQLYRFLRLHKQYLLFDSRA